MGFNPNRSSVRSIIVLAAPEASGGGALQPLQGFMTNPAGAAVVNAIGPLVRGEDKAQRRYLVIAPGTVGNLGAPVQIREHTRLGELARRWDARGRPESLLLRGDDVDAAKTWMASRKAAAPEIADAQRAFIGAMVLECKALPGREFRQLCTQAPG